MLQALAAGLAAGAIIGFFRLSYAGINARIVAYAQAHSFDEPFSLMILCAAPALLAVLAWLLLRHEPLTGGSGIPQTELMMRGRLTMNWGRVLWTKFLGTLISLAGGLSVGRGGPGILMGAVVGLGLNRLWRDKNTTAQHYLAGGSAAGFAAAFGAPAAGLCFAFEEIKAPSSPSMLFFTAIAAYSAWFVVDALFHFGRLFPFTALSTLAWRQWWLIPLAGGMAGVFGAIYNSALVGGTLLLDRARFLPRLFRVAAPFCISVILLCHYPQALVGFGPDAGALEKLSMPLAALLALFCVKALFSCASFASGVSGGLLMPILLVGAIGGALLATTLFRLDAVTADQSATVLALSMAGFFAATVRAPLTGTALLVEMTGSLSNAPAMLLVACLAAMTANRLKSPPVFDSLRLRLLNSGLCLPAPTNAQTGS